MGEPAFAISLLQAVSEVLGLKAVSDAAIQTAEYDGSPLSLALQKLEESFLKQSKVSELCRTPSHVQLTSQAKVRCR